jgi:uncharacterized protein (UPF0261 family)
MESSLLGGVVLQCVLEVEDLTVAGDVRSNVHRAEEAGRKEVVYVAAETAWVVAVAVRAWIGFDVESGVHGG